MRRPTLVLLVVLSLILTAALLKTIRGKRLRDILIILPENATEVEKGEVVYLRKCATCHLGGSPQDGPPLESVFSQRGSDWIQKYTGSPRRYNPEAFMPAINLSAQEQSRLFAYLSRRPQPVGRGSGQ